MINQMDERINVAHTMKDKIGLIGHNISYTLSPLIHNTAFKICGLPFSYVSLDISPENLSKTVSEMRSQNFIGANVTTPYKEAILSHVTTLSKTANIIGAVNTLIFRNNESVGENTDADGFLIAYKKDLELLKNEVVLVIGAGGAARAVLYVLLTSVYPSKIYITNRSTDHAGLIIKWVKEKFDFDNISIGKWQSHQLVTLAEKLRGVIQTTPIGSVNYPGENPLPEGFKLDTKHIVIDLVYRPHRTPLLEKAHGAAARTQNGIPMLIQQAASSFFLWTGINFPEEQITESLLHQIKNL